MLDIFRQRDFVLWVLCARLISVYSVPILCLFCLLLSLFRLPRRGLPRPIYTARAITPSPPLHGYHACLFPGYHAIALSSIPGLSHPSYHVPPHTYIGLSHPPMLVCSLPFTGYYATCSSPPTPPPGATRTNLLHTPHGPTEHASEFEQQ